MYFSDHDEKIIEKLKYNKSLRPRFDWLKNCLFWKDEEAHGLSEDGQTKLAHLWIARFFLFHSELPENKWLIQNTNVPKNDWNLAIESGLKWPGFKKNRLYLSEADKKYLVEEMSRPIII